ncbi:capsule biosynthesis protein CapG [Oenococcus oeni S13]|uniref:Stealth CR1 domain-containing protein n=1 Tax=Oenococcus oeni TaxID=1247 RepID=UPI00051074A6|nr:Stealth CR1 domain-containing protein [Oenococcus oeni]KGH62271.1 capsule biosynthesis protein CapG [Oenococcus oeni S13]
MIQKYKPIDFVVDWVDGGDAKWVAKKNKFSSGTEAEVENIGMNSEKAYREWGTFKYWFRGIEKFAPWVNMIYLVTDHQVPNWLDNSYEKIRVVDHTEIINNDYLPVFNSNAIEVNLYKIRDLSENFVLFNDDMYLTSPTKPTDFFSSDGLPKYNTSISPIIPEQYGTGNFQVNDMEIINKYFSRNEIIKNGHFLNPKQGIKNILKTLIYRNSKFVCGFFENHLPYSFQKSTIKTIWDKETNILKKTSESRFRSKENVSCWLFKYWQIASGEYSVGNSKMGRLFSLEDAQNGLWEKINSGKYKIMCINDSPNIKASEEEQLMNNFIAAMDKLFPEKSRFEK